MIATFEKNQAVALRSFHQHNQILFSLNQLIKAGDTAWQAMSTRRVFDSSIDAVFRESFCAAEHFGFVHIGAYRLPVSGKIGFPLCCSWRRPSWRRRLVVIYNSYRYVIVAQSAKRDTDVSKVNIDSCSFSGAYVACLRSNPATGLDISYFPAGKS